MKELFGVVGDIHGELDSLVEIVERARDRVETLIFVGDYVNRGTRSAEVVQYLVELHGKTQSCVFLAGNHDIAFREALDGSFDQFLAVGGAATIRSYVEPPYADVETQFQASVPQSHRHFLNGLRPEFLTNDFRVGHRPSVHEPDDRFNVYGHLPQRAGVPSFTEREALIDTGCGTWHGGRLTCLFLPSLQWIQV